MFLVNVPPLAAFQTQWTPFGHNAARRVAESLSPSSQVSSIPITTNVQGILDSHQNDVSSLPVTIEYERIMQKNRKGEPNIDRGLKASATLFKGHHSEKATLVVPPQFKQYKGESSQLGTLALDSDSDDSVDRDIEEAIQEYLKNKGNVAPLSDVAKSPSRSDNDAERLKAAQCNVPARKSPVKMVTSTNVCDAFTLQGQSRSSSPGSDDSFEQSISDEIQQFLINKKLQNSTREATSGSNNNTTVKPKQNHIKAVDKQAPKQGIKGLAGKPPPDSLNAQPKHPPKPKAESLKPNFCLKPASAPHKRHKLKEVVSRQRVELSDSSSDDGIEEAIQLYQLEKSRLAGGHGAVEKEAKSAVIAASNFSHCLDKTYSPESPKKTDCRKRKLPNSRHAASEDSLGCHPLTSKRTFNLGDDRSPTREVGVQATRRAETAAELMCAEAILDISKAILPSKSVSTLAASQETPSAQPVASDASDSTVDSDDSIEQEIRTFLARKAHAESLCTSSEKQPLPKELRPEHVKHQSLSSIKPLKRKSNENTLQKDLVEKGGNLEKRSSKVDPSAVNSALPQNENLLGKSAKICTEEQSDEAKQRIFKAVESLESSPGLSGCKRKMYMKMRSICSGDKSSSLDSDEDLDSAIKDLLRSKRKCKKRPKDGRPQCKKKVQFGETTARPLETFFGSSEQNYSSSKAPAVKGHLVNCNDPKVNLKSKTNMKLKEEIKSTAGNTDLSYSSDKSVESKPACASDRSMKSNSALPAVQDSSSVDSDDSIEQEIRKFLAKRALESAEILATQKTPSTVTSPNVNKVEASPACLSNPPPPVKQEPRVLSRSVTETILQKVREKNRSLAPMTQPAVIQRVCGFKDGVARVGRLHQHPADIPKGVTPVHSVIVKRSCVVEQNRIIRPAEKTPERVVVKTGVNGSQGNVPLSGNFVAGLKYISGTEQQLLLNLGKTGATRVATEIYNPGGTIRQLGSCQTVQKKTLILEQPKVVQAPAFSIGAPVVRPALYVVTTKVVQDASSPLCLPINTAAYDSGLNLMSIQYCHGQVASHPSARAAPFSFQPNRSSEIMGSAPDKAGEVSSLSNTAREGLEGGVRPGNFNEKAEACSSSVRSSDSSVQRDKVSGRSAIDPGSTVQPYIALSPEGMCNRSASIRRTCMLISQEKKISALHRWLRPCGVTEDLKSGYHWTRKRI
ncbi:protein phosphatase 1 regulatory subunit 26 [Pseudophryne corroboree]|uniref:protein phosphatase 1 regulatory subunit 26 n=1 Tax=Pseudophryne corroboree TaxID=495146 RepID=UPI0030814BF4